MSLKEYDPPSVWTKTLQKPVNLNFTILIISTSIPEHLFYKLLLAQ